MLYKFEADNIHCQNCANTILVSLEDDFGHIEIDLSKEPKTVSVALDKDSQVLAFKEAMSDLGFDILRQVQ